MQRFRLTSSNLRPDDFYLTVKELGGDERPLHESERPLEIFEELSERTSNDGLALPPNVRRSSIGSINSISSNLTLNPAITRSGVGDWSDDSAVKFYLHRRAGAQASFDLERTGGSEVQAGELGGPRSDEDAGHTANSSLGTSITAGPSYRFAVRLILHPSDLPDNVAFDPHSEAVIPKALLVERQHRSGSEPLESVSEPRQRILFFPRNANVSEVVETALDRFGISDGVVDGGDEVEDRLSRRRSAMRVKYSLAVEKDGKGESSPSFVKLIRLTNLAVSQNRSCRHRANCSTLTRLRRPSRLTTGPRESSAANLLMPVSSSAPLATFSPPTQSSSFVVRLTGAR